MTGITPSNVINSRLAQRSNSLTQNQPVYKHLTNFKPPVELEFGAS